MSSKHDRHLYQSSLSSSPPPRGGGGSEDSVAEETPHVSRSGYLTPEIATKKSSADGNEELLQQVSPKPLPPCRSGFHGASLLAAFHKEYPPDLPEPQNEHVKKEEEGCATQTERERRVATMSHSRLTMYHAATALCHLLILTESDEHNRFLYSLNSLLLLPGGRKSPAVANPPTFELTVLKGSIKTHVWSMAARYDDDYLLEVRHLPPLLPYQRRPLPPPSLSSSDPEYDSADLLWTMSGFELHTSRVGLGVVSWTNMKALHYFLSTQTVPHVAASLCAIGVTAFSRLFSKVVLGLPMRETLGSYFKPMPATLMLEDMLSVCSYPCEVVGFSAEDFEDPRLQGIFADLIESNGSGVWIENLYPEKLYSSGQQSSDKQRQWDAKTLRVVEIRKCPLASIIDEKSKRKSSLSSAGVAAVASTGNAGVTNVLLGDVVVVLATFSEKFPQQRFVSCRVEELCRYVREGPGCFMSAAVTQSLLPITANNYIGENEKKLSENEELEDGEIEQPEQSGDDFDICNEKEWKTKILHLVHQEEAERSAIAQRQSDEQERAELDLLSSRHSQNKTVLVPPHAFRSRDNDMIASLFDRNITAVDMLLEMVKEEEEEFVLTDDSNNLMQMITQNSNTSSSTQRSRSMTLESLGTFDTLDSIDMDFLNVSGAKEKEPSRQVDSCHPNKEECGKSQSDKHDGDGSSVASVYYSFRNSPETTCHKSGSGWNMQNIGTFGISFSDEEDWGSQTYHENALLQSGGSKANFSVLEGVMAAQQRSVLPLPLQPTLSPSSTNSAATTALSCPESHSSPSSSSSKKRKGRQDVSSPRDDDDAKDVTVNFGFDSMSIQSAHPKFSGIDCGDKGRGGKSAPTSSYKLYSRNVLATQLWPEGSVVFLPAKDLLKQFSCSLQIEKVEQAMKRNANKSSGALVKEKKSGGTLEKCYFEAVVTHPTNRQVILSVGVLGKDVKRGLNFMENQCKSTMLGDDLFVLQKEHLVRSPAFLPPSF